MWTLESCTPNNPNSIVSSLALHKGDFKRLLKLHNKSYSISNGISFQEKDLYLRAHLLIVDDEESVRESFRLALQDKYELTFAEDIKSALKAIKLREYDLCLLDILLPDGSGLDLLKQIKRRDETLDILMVTALQGVNTALEAMKLGAFDYVTKPYKLEDLYAILDRTLRKRELEREIRYFHEERQKEFSFLFLGTSPVMRELRQKIEKIASQDLPTLLSGKMGCAQEEVAREIHLLSSRAKSPFVRLDCFSVPRRQWDVELFGCEGNHSKGNQPQTGKLEFAQGGILFLDHIDSMPAPTQEKLAKVLSEKRFNRLDTHTVQTLDARIIASMETDPSPPKPSLSLRPVLYKILNATSLTVPALKERKEDLSELIRHILKRASLRAGKPGKTLQKEANQFLIHYPWPGNLPEMETVLEMMVFFSKNETLSLEDVPLDLLVKHIGTASTPQEAKISLKKVRRNFEKHYIRKILEQTRGNQTRTASALGLHRNTLIWKLKELDLEGEYHQIVKTRRESRLGYKDL